MRGKMAGRTESDLLVPVGEGLGVEALGQRSKLHRVAPGGVPTRISVLFLSVMAMAAWMVALMESFGKESVSIVPFQSSFRGAAAFV